MIFLQQIMNMIENTRTVPSISSFSMIGFTVLLILYGQRRRSAIINLPNVLSTSWLLHKVTLKQKENLLLRME